MAPKRSTLDVLNEQSRGRLAKDVNGWHAEGVSTDEMIYRLRMRHIRVSSRTLTRWISALDATEATK